MIIGDNHFIQNRILNSSAILDAVPQLRTLASHITRLTAICGTCSGNEESRRQLDEVWNNTRRILVQLPEETRAMIRSRVSHGQAVRIAYRVGKGGTTKIESGVL